ncbi:uncharacterized protein LOC141849362 [Brevipalpus obovatus]|uniref:uncharacterized protein LOC141849362 n=1 Tax=Brevipalpus obovatus TaxID=246614 RepID=UPI003D9F2C2F
MLRGFYFLLILFSVFCGLHADQDNFGPTAGQLFMFFGIPMGVFVIMVIAILALRHWYWKQYGFGPGVQQTIITQTTIPGVSDDPFNHNQNTFNHHHNTFNHDHNLFNHHHNTFNHDHKIGNYGNLNNV